MRYGIFSDIHGNWEALQEILRFCQKEGVNDFISLGDVVGYGANPKECLDMIRGLDTVCVAGNHDWAVSGRFNFENFHHDAQEAVIWTRNQLFSDDMDFLNSLSLVFKNEEFIAVHGTLGEPERFRYLFYMSDALQTFHLMDRPICFTGHSHVPQVLVQEGERVVCLNKMSVKANSDYKYIVNVGSVGQPRDGNPKASCCLFDSQTRDIDIVRISYDYQSACDKILKAGLPPSLAYRLLIGM